MHSLWCPYLQSISLVKAHCATHTNIFAMPVYACILHAPAPAYMDPYVGMPDSIFQRKCTPRAAWDSRQAHGSWLFLQACSTRRGQKMGGWAYEKEAQ